MCGIAGIFRNNGRPVSEAELGPLADALTHRGPDGKGMYACGSLGIAMTRLAIIDVTGGQQPIFNEDRTLAIVCNGEIYNHPTLRARLEKSGHEFRTHSDVEVILHLYEELGEKCFGELNGMFAVAIADYERGRLVLARDRFGQKPLYLWKRRGELVFSSELKALAQQPGFSRELSQEALASYFTFRYVPAPLTIFQEASKLPPGSYAVFDHSGESEIRRYWQIDFGEDDQQSPSSDPRLMREKLTESVSRHLMSERPLGVFLSGGLDSAAVVACMYQLGHRQIHTYTVGFEGFLDNEFDSARRIAECFGTDHQEISLTADDFWETMEQVVYASDEPLADLTCIPLYHLSREARRDVVVVLSGEGSDELLGGYPGCEDLRRLFERLHLLRPLAPLAKHLLTLGWPDGIHRRLMTLAGTDADYFARNPSSMSFVFEDGFLKKNVSHFADLPSTVKPLSRYFAARGGWDGTNLYLGGLIEWWLPDDLLHKADRMTMAHALELRCPFLDAEFSSYCAHLPLDDRVRPSKQEPSRKVALKRAFASVLPDRIANQPKKGFTIPAYSWMSNVFADRARAEINRPAGLVVSLLSRQVRQNIVNSAVAGDVRMQRQAWSLVVLNRWANRWLRGGSSYE